MRASRRPLPRPRLAGSNIVKRVSAFAAATGIGSWPGTSPREAAEIVIGELHTLPHLVVSDAGVKTLTVKVSSKNDASAGYNAYLEAIQLRRTN